MAAAFAVGLSAQAPAPSGAQTPAPSATSQSERAGSVSVTGCLRAGAEPNSFVLEDIKTDKAGSTASNTTTAPGATTPGGQSGMTGTTGTSGTMASKALEGADKVNVTGSPSGVTMSSHVGHTVKLTGTLAPRSESSASASANASRPGQPSASASAGTTPSLHVTGLSMVSSTCSE
jgi:hypothetical protein